MTTNVATKRTTTLRKQANRFKVGEVLYLHGCDTGDLYGFLRGAFKIDEVKHQSSTGVSFFLIPAKVGVADVHFHSGRTYLLEFLRTDKLSRLRGPMVTYVIEENP